MTRNSAILLMAALMIARGTSFLFSKLLMEGMGPLNVLGVRFLLSFVILAIIFHKHFKQLDKKTIRAGIIIGLLYTACMVAEMYGLRLVDTGTSSFMENSAVVFIVIIEFFIFRKRPGKIALISIAITICGLGLLTLSSGLSALNIGYFLSFLAMVLYALAIMCTAYLSKDISDPIMIGVIQLGVMGAISMILSPFFETPRLPQGGAEWGMMLMLVIVCSCFGFTLQPMAQKYLDANTAGLVSVVNPMSTWIMGIIFAGELVNAPRIIGCILILIGILISIKKSAPKDSQTNIAKNLENDIEKAEIA